MRSILALALVLASASSVARAETSDDDARKLRAMEVAIEYCDAIMPPTSTELYLRANCLRWNGDRLSLMSWRAIEDLRKVLKQCEFEGFEPADVAECMAARDPGSKITVTPAPGSTP